MTTGWFIYGIVMPVILGVIGVLGARWSEHQRKLAWAKMDAAAAQDEVDSVETAVRRVYEANQAMEEAFKIETARMESSGKSADDLIAGLIDRSVARLTEPERALALQRIEELRPSETASEESKKHFETFLRATMRLSEGYRPNLDVASELASMREILEEERKAATSGKPHGKATARPTPAKSKSGSAA